MHSIKQQYLAKLAKLELSEDWSNEFNQDFEEILNFIRIIDMLDISNVFPLTHITQDLQLNNSTKDENPLNISEVFSNSCTARDELSSDYFVIKQNIIKGKNYNEL